VRVQIEIDEDLRRTLQEFAERRLREVRERFVETVMTQTLSETSANNPVATGRSRAAWEAALAQVSAAGNGTDSSEGTLERTATPDTTELRATNSVPYVPSLEYGTFRRAPAAMVRRALTHVARNLAPLFSLD